MDDFEASASASFTKPRHRRDGVITRSYAHRWMEPDGEHPISDDNRRQVIRQVTKLVSGEGVHYDSVNFGWPDDDIFRKGTAATMQLDAVPNQNSELHAIDATIFTQVGHRPDHRGRARRRNEHGRATAGAGSSTTRSASSSSTSTTSTRRRAAAPRPRRRRRGRALSKGAEGDAREVSLRRREEGPGRGQDERARTTS